ncbi:uncharacterized protein LOC126893072 [Diabrotica virgifera virgifera]|uniref:THAP-type domain-containing protein n=1 Tax=Diabrotica virgifera virgifera TaxID=50390 RepID=A0ABM5L953_DIAVI|nr:uncharacterized protein LOC126893072 [Diabrotica virgifera virgifera]
MASVTHKCVYAGCFERNDGTNNNISFFKFPLKDVERTKIWQKNCGNIDILLMDITDLIQRVICQHHFAVEHIYQSGQRKLLRKNAVPLKFTQLTTDLGDIPPVCSTYVYCGTKRKRSTSDDCMVRSTPSPKRSSSTLSDISSFEINLPTKLETELTEKVKKLEYQVNALKKKCRQKNSQCCRRTTKNKKSATKFMLQVLLENKSKYVHTFVNMQFSHKTRSQWSHNEKDLALAIYYKSPSCYKFLIRSLNFILPSVKTIQTWLRVIKLRTGLNTSLIDKLKKKAETMDELEKICVLMFDEISLKKKLEYNKLDDIIEGFQDLGALGRTNKLTNTGLVFMMRGLLHNWKIPICYFVTAIHSDNLKNIVVEVVSKLQNIGYIPKVLVCDQASNNRALFKLLGACKDQPAIEIGNQRIFTVLIHPTY